MLRTPRLRPVPLLLAALIPCALPLGAQETAPAATEAAPSIEVTFLANAGFMLESERHTVLIDAFVRDPTVNYEALPPRTYGKLVNARAPFDGPAHVLVSHRHDDHVQMRSLEKFLNKSPESFLYSSSQVILTLKRDAQDFASIRPRVRSITGEGKENRSVDVEGLRIDFFELRHAGTDNENVENLAHLIDLDGVKVLHVGDAFPVAADFAVHELGAREIDLALVPYWFLISDEAVAFVRDWLRPHALFVCHVPMIELDESQERYGDLLPNTVVLTQHLQRFRVAAGGKVEALEPEDDDG